MAKNINSSTEKIADIFFMPTTELLKRFADYNPRDHTDDDIQWTGASLLEVGWATVICINEETGTIVGGHARTLAADFLRKQEKDWFDSQFEEWMDTNPDRPAIAEKHKHRFSSDFWEVCPCIGIKADQYTEKSTNIRLNSTSREGKNNPAKIAAMLSRLPEKLQDHAGFDRAVAKSYIDAYLEKAPVGKPVVEFQPKQFFERPDATVYDGDGAIVEPEELQTVDAIPDDWTVEVEGKSYSVDDLEAAHEEEQQQAIALDDLNLDNLDGSEFRGASIDKDIAETRIVLLVSRNDLAEYSEKIGAIADKLGIPRTGSSKVWKPNTIMALIRNAYEEEND